MIKRFSWEKFSNLLEISSLDIIWFLRSKATFNIYKLIIFEILDIRLPAHVVLKVVKTEPGFKGNTATGATKPAIVETGLELNVPLFINEEEHLKIDTRSGEYVERAKEKKI